MIFNFIINLSFGFQRNLLNFQDIVMRTELLSEILEKYLLDQESVIFFNIKTTNGTLGNYTIKEAYFLSNLAKIRPVIVYKGLNQSNVDRLSDMGNEMKQPSTTKSYLSITAYKPHLLNSLKYFSKINTNGKWIFIVAMKSEDVKDVFIKAWQDYQMSNIMFIFEKSYNKFHIAMFNPFDRSESSYGKFYEIEINKKNLNSILNLIEEFSRRYGRKIINYELKKLTVFGDGGFNSILDNQMEDLFDFAMKIKMKNIQIGQLTFKTINLRAEISVVDRGEVDIMISNRLVYPYGMKNITFLYPVYRTTLYYITRKHERLISQLNFHVLGAYDMKFKIIYILLFLTMVSIIHSQMNNNISESFLIIISILSLVSLPLSKLKIKKSHQRITIGFLWIFAVIVCGAFQGRIVSKLNHDEEVKEINSLKELVESNYSLTAITIVPNPLKPHFSGEHISEIYKKLYQRTQVSYNISDESISLNLEKTNHALLSEFIN